MIFREVVGNNRERNLEMIETFLVREVGRGRDVEERSLEVTEVSREGGRR